MRFLDFYDWVGCLSLGVALLIFGAAVWRITQAPPPPIGVPEVVVTYAQQCTKEGGTPVILGSYLVCGRGSQRKQSVRVM